MSSNRAPPSASAPYGTDTTTGLPSLGMSIAAVGAVRAAAAGVVAVGDAEAGVVAPGVATAAPAGASAASAAASRCASCVSCTVRPSSSFSVRHHSAALTSARAVAAHATNHTHGAVTARGGGGAPSSVGAGRTSRHLAVPPPAYHSHLVSIRPPYTPC